MSLFEPPAANKAAGDERSTQEHEPREPVSRSEAQDGIGARILGSTPVRSLALLLVYPLGMLLGSMIYSLFDMLGLIWTPGNFYLDTDFLGFDSPQRLLCIMTAWVLLCTLPWLRKERGEPAVHPVIVTALFGLMPVWFMGVDHLMPNLSDAESWGAIAVSVFSLCLGLAYLRPSTPRRKTREMSLLGFTAFLLLGLLLTNQDSTFPTEGTPHERDAWAREHFHQVYPQAIDYLRKHPDLPDVVGLRPHLIVPHSRGRNVVWPGEKIAGFHLSFHIKSQAKKTLHRRCVLRGYAKEDRVIEEHLELYCLDEHNNEITLEPKENKATPIKKDDNQKHNAMIRQKQARAERFGDAAKTTEP